MGREKRNVSTWGCAPAFSWSASTASSVSSCCHIIYLFVDVHEYEIIEKANQFIVTSCTYFIPLGLLCLLRYSIQGLGYSKLAMMSGVFEMVDRTAVSLFLVPILGYTGVCYGDPSAWFAADLRLTFTCTNACPGRDVTCKPPEN